MDETIKGQPRHRITCRFAAIFLFAISVVPWFHPAKAQQPTKLSRIGWLTGSTLSSNAHRTDAFRQGLRELGYVEGKNIVIEWRGADGDRDRQRALAVELVRLKVDVIVTSGGGPTRAVKEETDTIPIVFAQDTDPIGNGFVASLARPGGNITGLSRLAPELTGKQVELLKEVVPRLSRVAVFATLSSPSYAQALKEIELAAGALKVMLQYLDVQGPKGVEAVPIASIPAGSARPRLRRGKKHYH